MKKADVQKIMSDFDKDDSGKISLADFTEISTSHFLPLVYRSLLICYVFFVCYLSSAHAPCQRITCCLCPSENGFKYSGTSDEGPSEIGTTSLQRTLVVAPCKYFSVLFYL